MTSKETGVQTRRDPWPERIWLGDHDNTRSWCDYGGVYDEKDRAEYVRLDTHDAYCAGVKAGIELVRSMAMEHANKYAGAAKKAKGASKRQRLNQQATALEVLVDCIRAIDASTGAPPTIDRREKP